MRVVLYTDDMEPITVIDLSDSACGYLTEYGQVRLAVLLPINLSVVSGTQVVDLDAYLHTVTIFAEKFIRHGQKHMLLFTGDEESAMLLKSTFLPGQRKELQEREKMAFAKGFFDAISRIGNN